MGEFQSSQISAPTGTGALQNAPNPGKHGVFSVYKYIEVKMNKILLLLVENFLITSKTLSSG